MALLLRDLPAVFFFTTFFGAGGEEGAGVVVSILEVVGSSGFLLRVERVELMLYKEDKNGTISFFLKKKDYEFDQFFSNEMEVNYDEIKKKLEMCEKFSFF